MQKILFRIKETLMCRVTANADNLFNHERQFMYMIDGMEKQTKTILENIDLMKKHTKVLNEDWAGILKKNFFFIWSIFFFFVKFLFVFFVIFGWSGARFTGPLITLIENSYTTAKKTADDVKFLRDEVQDLVDTTYVTSPFKNSRMCIKEKNKFFLGFF